MMTLRVKPVMTKEQNCKYDVNMREMLITSLGTFSILHVQYSETPKAFRAIHSNLALSFQCCVTIPPQVKKRQNVCK